MTSRRTAAARPRLTPARALARSQVSGGESSTINTGAPYSTIGGGFSNDIAGTAQAVTISGGKENYAKANAATIAGGEENRVGEDWAIHAVVSGGRQNEANGQESNVGGGCVRRAAAAPPSAMCARRTGRRGRARRV